MTPDPREIAIARVICQQRCALVGDTACWIVDSGALHRHCTGPDDLDCVTIGRLAVRDVLREEG